MVVYQQIFKRHVLTAAVSGLGLCSLHIQACRLSLDQTFCALSMNSRPRLGPLLEHVPERFAVSIADCRREEALTR